MFKILNQPYPQRERTFTQSLIHSFTEGLFVFAFFAIFQPFGISEWNTPNKLLYLLGFGLITSGVSLLIKAFLPKLAPHYYKEENWVIWKEILDVFFILFLITLFVMLFNSYILHWKLSIISFLMMFKWVCIIGFFPTIFWVMYDYIDKLKKYSKPIQVIHHESPQEEQKQLEFIAENAKDKFYISSNDLLFIESTDNYATIYFLKNEVVQKELLRSSLSRLETQINKRLIQRCHRSFIANLEKVEQISGNAQGYKLHIPNGNFVVPVARKYSSIIEMIK